MIKPSYKCKLLFFVSNSLIGKLFFRFKLLLQEVQLIIGFIGYELKVIKFVVPWVRILKV